jgi:predicted dehydrogenase
MKKLRIGVLSTAKIGLKKVVPGMQQGHLTEVTAIASRSLESAQKAADELKISKAYGTYEELLADPDLDAIYNPLPNNLHVEWTAKAARAGKHVLCEKPIALNAEQAETLLAVQRETGVKIAEAFMVKLHPEWIRTHELIAQGRIGELRLVTSTFSYFNDDPNNIRNKPENGGGALMDIGCYQVFAARQLFGAEPTRALALIDRDPTTHIDRLTSFLLDFPAGQANFTCSTQLIPYQRVQALGTKGRIELEIPVNVPPDRNVRLFLDEHGDLFGKSIMTELFPPDPGGIDQYTLQGDAFAQAIFDNTEVPVPLTAAIQNMKVIDALFRSAETGTWQSVEATKPSSPGLAP